MNYALNKQLEKNGGNLSAIRKILPLIRLEKKNIFFAFVAVMINSGLSLLAPSIIGYVVETYVRVKRYDGILIFSGILLVIYIFAATANYLQIRLIGVVGRRTLFRIRNKVFTKIQELPMAFFNQNQAGDLISRINNDSEKLNQFFSQALMQFVGNTFIVVGAAVFILVINAHLALVALIPAVFLLLLTRFLSAFVKKANARNLRSTGEMSAEVQESLNNFKVIVAFNRQDYFNKKFAEINHKNYLASMFAGFANKTLSPLYDLMANFAQLIVLVYGIYLVMIGQLSVGFLISFILYINIFYDPLRQIASLWTTFQTALAALDRIVAILSLESDMSVIAKPKQDVKGDDVLMEFSGVSFAYPEGKEVLRRINLRLEKGKTYALVGPTGGGKTTTASLMARLYDPSLGEIYLDGKDIRTYSHKERTKKIGFILQEPFLFKGDLRENLLYGNYEFAEYSEEKLMETLEEDGLSELLVTFKDGLKTQMSSGGESVSLGQKQLTAFMRAILRKPQLLILDEATANIDTVTEKLLEKALEKLPRETTRVIIAHRLNTIESADEIFFINSGEVTTAGSMDNAVKMLINGIRAS